MDKGGKGFRNNIILAFLVKGGSLLAGFLTAPAILRYFDSAVVLGVWYTLVSALLLLLNFDLGIGNGLRNKLTWDFSEGNLDSAGKTLSTGLLAYAGLAGVLGLLGWLVIPELSWNQFFGVAEVVISPETLVLAMRIVLFGVLLRFVLLTVASVLNALQMTAVNNLLALCASVLQLLFLLWVKPEDPEQGLILLSGGYALLTNLPAGVAGLILYFTRLKDCRPSWKKARWGYLRRILGVGTCFFVCQIAYMLILNTNEMLISAFFGPQYTAEYTFYYKLATLTALVLAPALTPVWSAVAQAMAQGRGCWVEGLYRKLKLAALAAVLAQFALVFVQQPVMDLWLGPGRVTVDYDTALVFACFGGAFAYGIILSTLVSGMGRLGMQMRCYCAGAAGKLLLMPFLGHWRRVVLCNAAVLWLYCVLQQRDLDRYFRRS